MKLLRLGNCPTNAVAEVPIRHYRDALVFEQDADSGVLIIDR